MPEASNKRRPVGDHRVFNQRMRLLKLSKRFIRRSVHARATGHSQGQIVDAISIRERPAEIEDRAIPGNWEGDLLAGSKNTHIATLVERHSRFVILVKVPSKDTATVVAPLSRQVRKLPASLRRSLTWNRGLELASHKNFTVTTKVDVYFCDPQSPWHRGSNENTNGLLRRYFPKKTDSTRHGRYLSVAQRGLRMGYFNPSLEHGTFLQPKDFSDLRNSAFVGIPEWDAFADHVQTCALCGEI